MGATLMKFKMLNNTLDWTLSFPIFTWRNALFEDCTLRFGSEDCVPFFREIDFDFGGSVS